MWKTPKRRDTRLALTVAEDDNMKVPEPRKLPSNTWFIQLRLNGVSVPITGSTEKECRDTAQLVKSEHRAGKRQIQKEKANPTLRQAIDNYIAARSNTLSPSTVDGYRRIQKNRFKGVMDKKLKDIGDWQKICNSEAKLCAPKTLRNAYRFIVSVLTENGQQAPKVTLPQMSGNERKWLDPEQITKLVNASFGKIEALSVLLALHSLRRSEILALDWKNVDLKNNKITVKGAVVPNEEHKFIHKETNKNATSSRTIKIMIPELAATLSAVKNKSGAVITCSPHTVCNRINKACREASLPEVGTHGLRHSFASLAYHLGMSELETMEIGGWADTQTMHKIYTHLAQQDRLKAENKMTEFYKNANQNANQSKKASVFNAYTTD